MLAPRHWPPVLATVMALGDGAAHVGGRVQLITEEAGAQIIDATRMWHHPEGVRNWDQADRCRSPSSR